MSLSFPVTSEAGEQAPSGFGTRGAVLGHGAAVCMAKGRAGRAAALAA